MQETVENRTSYLQALKRAKAYYEFIEWRRKRDGLKVFISDEDPYPLSQASRDSCALHLVVTSDRDR